MNDEFYAVIRPTLYRRRDGIEIALASFDNTFDNVYSLLIRITKKPYFLQQNLYKDYNPKMIKFIIEYYNLRMV
jgi:Mg2+ and Co2+ transporter CorA